MGTDNKLKQRNGTKLMFDFHFPTELHFAEGVESQLTKWMIITSEYLHTSMWTSSFFETVKINIQNDVICTTLVWSERDFSTINSTPGSHTFDNNINMSLSFNQHTDKSHMSFIKL